MLSATKFGCLSQAERNITRLSADQTFYFNATPLNRSQDHISPFWVFQGVTIRANNFNIVRFITKFWMVTVREFVVTMKIFGQSASLALPSLFHLFSNNQSDGMSPFRDATFPIWVIFPSRHRDTSAGPRAIQHFCSPMLGSGKFFAAFQTAGSKKLRPFLNLCLTSARSRTAMASGSDVGIWSGKFLFANGTLKNRAAATVNQSFLNSHTIHFNTVEA